MAAGGATEFQAATRKFGQVLTEAVSTVGGGVELAVPDAALTDALDLKPASVNAAVADEATLGAFEACITEWCKVRAC
jgi:dynein heavy chain